MSKKQCENPAVYRFTWPGKDEDYICAIHAVKTDALAHHIGLQLQFIPLTPEEMGEHVCFQMVHEAEGE